MMLLTFKAGYHFIDQIINVEQFQFHRRVVHRVRQVVGDGVAERCNGTILIGSAPLAEEVRETVDEDS